jgi:hypothetical protein
VTPGPAIEPLFISRHVAPLDTWPDLRVVVRPLPWTWRVRPRWYADDVDGPIGHWSLAWLFVTIEWWGQKGGWLDQFMEVESG